MTHSEKAIHQTLEEQALQIIRRMLDEHTRIQACLNAQLSSYRELLDILDSMGSLLVTKELYEKLPEGGLHGKD